jgi:hypothetical protein
MPMDAAPTAVPTAVPTVVPTVVRRAGLATGAVTALALSFLAGMAVAGSPTAVNYGPDPAPPVDLPITLANADLAAPGSCDALLESYVERGVERVGPWGWDGPPYVAYAEGGTVDDSTAGSAAEPAVPRGAVTEQESSATGTNVQEVGVDEPDVVKTDGSVLVRVRDGDLEVHDVTGDEPVEVADVDLPEGSPSEGAELLLADDRVVVVAGDEQATTRVTTYDLSDPASPALVDDRGVEGALVRAVQHDDTVRLVVTTGLPDLDFVQPRFWRSEDGARERNQDVVRRSTLEDWLPDVTTYDADGDEVATTPLLECSDVVVPAEDDAALGTMTMMGLDVDDPAGTDSLGIATDTRLAYFSPDRMYLATSPWSTWWGCCWDDGTVAPDVDTGRSHLYSFALDDTGAEYVASGVVDGRIEDRWSMDEHEGVLRVAVGATVETGNFSSVLTLREDGDDLEEVGRVDELGVDEEIKAVRWFDDLAIVVTFRQVDPLYAVDLSDPDRPELLGELKIPGYSEYLHPISGDRLIGLGQDATLSGQVLGAQAALFDVRDLTDPRQTDVLRYRSGSVAGAATDPRQFTWLPDRQTALAVVWDGWEGRTGWVSVLEVDGDRLAQRLVEVEHGADVAHVRTVPLPDGRVALVTDDGVTFLDL